MATEAETVIKHPNPVDIPPRLERERPLRIAVLAEGAITPLGNSADETWEGFKDMRTGIVEHLYHPYTDPREEGKRPPQIKATTAGTIKDFDPIKALVDTGFMPKSEVQLRLDPYAIYTLAASFEALRKVKTADGVELLVPRLRADGTLNKAHQWTINQELIHPLLFSIFVGTGFGGGDVTSEVSDKLKEGTIPDEHMMRSLNDRAASTTSQATEVKGGAEADTAACASSGKALLNAIYRIHAGAREVALVVGTEGILNKPIGSAMFDTMGTLDPGKDPLTVSRSLHKIRRGFTMAEGAVAFVIADYDWAKQNGITILYEIIGVGDTSGAGHNTDPNTAAQEQAMKLARRGGEWHGPIQGKVMVSGHFTGTVKGEVSEMFAIQNTLVDLKDRTSIYASKRLVGHMLGAAGNLSQFVAGRALQDKVIPGMVFDGEIMDQADGWNIPRETHSEEDLTDVEVNQFGFGDANVATHLRVAS